MYEAFYGLTGKPFTLLPDPGFLYMGEKHDMAFAMLEYGLVSQAGISVITGGIGYGKTTVIRHLANQLGKDMRVGLLTNTHRFFGELLEQILLTFDVQLEGRSKAELYHAFVNYLIEQYGENRRTVLIIDEAQNMELDALEELRLLSNVNTDKALILQLILVGQPQLWTKLRDPRLEQFVQRITVDYVLEPLDAIEVAKYISHRLRVAGRDKALFDDEALAMIALHSRGVPRVINMLCDRALVYGYAKQMKSIGGELMRQVICDRAKGGLFDNKLSVVAQHSPAAASGDRVELSPSTYGKTEGNLLRQALVELEDVLEILKR
jgi:type II secretory pathway predicted ATPase ExeA